MGREELTNLAWWTSVVLNVLLIGFFVFIVLSMGLPAGRLQLVLAILMLAAPGASLVTLALVRPS
jgi:hypothetical protein